MPFQEKRTPPLLSSGARRLAGCAGLALAVLACALSTLPDRFKHDFHIQGALHVWLHLGVFAMLAGLAVVAPGRPWVRAALLPVVMGLGAGMEWTEAVRNHLNLETADICTDAWGVLLGAAVAVMLGFQRRA